MVTLDTVNVKTALGSSEYVLLTLAYWYYMRYWHSSESKKKKNSGAFYPLKSNYGNYTSYLYRGLASGKILKLALVLAPARGLHLESVELNIVKVQNDKS